MKHPSQEDLLGYVLGALEAQQHRDVQQLIDADPQLEEELLKIKASLQPLDYVDQPAGPPPGLARRACEMVASFDKTGRADFAAASFDNGCPDRMAGVGSGIASSIAAAAVEPETKPAFTPANDAPSSLSGGWSMSDLLVGVAALAVLAAILLPAISYTRFQSRVSSCQNNLRSLGAAMLSFSSNDPCDAFPQVAAEGNMSVSGAYAPILKDCGLVEDDDVFACPGLMSDKQMLIPSRQEVLAANGPRLVYLQHSMGGNYGYTMGYAEGSQLCQLKNLGRINMILLSDMPSRDLEGRRSNNHEARGQNLLFEDGRVEFVPGIAWANDRIFENDYGIVAPGVDHHDNVIAPSHLGPNNYFRSTQGMTFGAIH